MLASMAKRPTVLSLPRSSEAFPPTGAQGTSAAHATSDTTTPTISTTRRRTRISQILHSLRRAFRLRPFSSRYFFLTAESDNTTSATPATSRAITEMCNGLYRG